ncbi:phosphatase PAP2 family protein [Altererythrobacter xixiisoli]|uniref:Phosphatase PAP2 family protein n=2 Tax=Croceibacterium xixiisoli TaxID=1476466 RepID=A0A6I4TWU6_9SPHN|nr:phosphatase PAP2 family protein [Croceibacterium xixiisoli]
MAWLVADGKTAPFDRAGLMLGRDAQLNPWGPAFLSEAARDITALGGTSLRLLAAMMAAFVLLRLQRRLAALFVGVAMAGGLLINTGLKLMFARPRPDFLPHLTEAGGSSFPSGHSFGAATIMLALALVCCGFARHATARRLLIGGALLLSASVAWTRVWLGVHYPSDVIAGWLGGVGWTLLLVTLLPFATLPGTARGAG